MYAFSRFCNAFSRSLLLVSPRLTLHGGVQNVLDKRLRYDRFGYVIDPARLWLGLGTRF